MSFRYQLGVDVGGTFTDVVLADAVTGQPTFAKVLTTPHDASIGVLDGVRELIEASGVDPAEVERVVHATTLVGNAIIEGKCARTALICTRGFRDVLSLGREWRYDIYDSHLTFPVPLVKRQDRFEVEERVGADGGVLVPLSAESVDDAVTKLGEGGFETVAVALLHAYRNDVHERMVADAIHERLPAVAVSTSADVLPQAGEYERFCAAVMNAAVQPLARSYLDRLVNGLVELGFPSALFIMSSNGGLLTPATAARYPIRLFESGPVAGALGAALCGVRAEESRVLSFDMGGTTAKACVIRDGTPTTTNEMEVARVQRLTKGSGFPVVLPAVDMLEIGAGGGSLVRVNELGLLTVGPDSAGADPGPVCYARGGAVPTVTDANLLLGYLSPGFFLGGDMRLDIDAAERALGEVGAQVGMSAVEVAWGVHEIVSQNMANALRTHAIEKGVDYRTYTLTAFGGAGPMHAYRIADLLSIERMLFPWGPGVFSALGLLTAPIQFDSVRTLPLRVESLQNGRAEELFGDMERELLDVLSAAGVAAGSAELSHSADVRYAGQGVTLTVDVPIAAEIERDLVPAFTEAYEQRYGWTPGSADVEVVNWRCNARGPMPSFAARGGRPEAAGDAVKGEREVYVSQNTGFQTIPVYDRYRLAVGAKVPGPCVVEERECTILLGADADGIVDDRGSLVVRLAAGGGK